MSPTTRNCPAFGPSSRDPGWKNRRLGPGNAPQIRHAGAPRREAIFGNRATVKKSGIMSSSDQINCRPEVFEQQGTFCTPHRPLTCPEGRTVACARLWAPCLAGLQARACDSRHSPLNRVTRRPKLPPLYDKIYSRNSNRPPITILKVAIDWGNRREVRMSTVPQIAMIFFLIQFIVVLVALIAATRMADPQLSLPTRRLSQRLLVRAMTKGPRD